MEQCCSCMDRKRQEFSKLALLSKILYKKTPSRPLLSHNCLYMALPAAILATDKHVQTIHTSKKTRQAKGAVRKTKEEFSDNKLVEFAPWQNSGSLWLSLINLYGIEPASSEGLSHWSIIFVCVCVCACVTNPQVPIVWFCLVQPQPVLSHTHAIVWELYEKPESR